MNMKGRTVIIYVGALVIGVVLTPVLNLFYTASTYTDWLSGVMFGSSIILAMAYATGLVIGLIFMNVLFIVLRS